MICRCETLLNKIFSIYIFFCSEKEPGETRMPWSLTRPKRKDWSEFSTFRKKKNVTSLLHEVSLKDVTPPLDETPPSDRSYGEGERNFGDKSLAFRSGSSHFRSLLMVIEY